MSVTITISGRLSRDVEKSSDNAPYKLSIPQDGMIRKDGKFEETKWYNIVVWEGKNGFGRTPALDLIERLQAKGNTLKKGSFVTVVGVPQYEVTEKDGQTMTYESIKAISIEYENVGQGRSESGSTGSNSGQLPLDEASSPAPESNREVPLL